MTSFRCIIKFRYLEFFKYREDVMKHLLDFVCDLRKTAFKTVIWNMQAERTTGNPFLSYMAVGFSCIWGEHPLPCACVCVYIYVYKNNKVNDISLLFLYLTVPETWNAHPLDSWPFAVLLQAIKEQNVQDLYIENLGTTFNDVLHHSLRRRV
jgi:hypothetical protein